MVNIQICSESSTTNSTLRNHIHSSIEKFHKRNSPGRLSIIGYSSTAVTKFSKVAGSTSSNLSLHNNLSHFVSNTFYAVRNMNIKTRNRQTSLRSHISPYRRRKAYPALCNHFFKSWLQFWLIQSFCRSSCNSFDGTFYSFPFQQISSVQHLLGLFIQPPYVLFFHNIFIFTNSG